MNHAERRGDYWNYGGIFRPVYLEAVPIIYIEHLTLNATAVGSLNVDVRLTDLRAVEPGGLCGDAGARVERQARWTWVTTKDVAFDGTTHLS